jgi:hypothetical protein
VEVSIYIKLIHSNQNFAKHMLPYWINFHVSYSKFFFVAISLFTWHHTELTSV